MKFKKIQLSRIIYLLFKGVFSFVALTAVLVLFPVMAHALIPVTLAWDESNPVPDGYIIYWGASSGNYANSYDVGNATQYTIADLQEGVTYFFAVTAYDDDGDVRNESAYSEEISYTVAIPNSNPTTPSMPSGPSSGFIQTDYSFNSTASDPDNGTLQYRYDWGDDVISGWGNSTQNHAWSITGNYCVRAQARDVHDATSGWSNCGSINIGLNTYTIAASAGAHGSITPSGSVVVNDGDFQTFSITPEQDYRVLDVVVDGSSVGGVTTYTFNNIEGDHTIEVRFVLDNQPPVSNAGADQTVEEGDVVTLSALSSTDVDNNIDSYSWRQKGGTSVEILNPDNAEATFIAPIAINDPDNLTFELTITDTEDLQDVDTCVVHVTKVAVMDSDGDGVPDSQDAFPSDPTESVDTDGDGYGNNFDDDDDDDGMTDAWEIANNLEPLVNDADGDPDDDGVSNFDEFENRTNPHTFEDHNEPDAPFILTPLDDTIVALTPELTVDEFYDPDIDDVHAESQWQIFRADNDFCVLDVTTPSSLTSLKVPKLILDEDTEYTWQVRFINNHDKESEWSEVGTFTTDTTSDDDDGNGIPDHQEVGLAADLDNDGVLDRDQTDIKCVIANPEDDFQIGLSVKDAINVDSIVSMGIEDPDEEATTAAKSKGNPKKLQFGLVDFKILVKAPGDETEVAIHLSKAAFSKGKLYKYDPINAEWLDYSDYAEFSPNRKVVYLTLKDGGFGDADGIENGIIIDPLTIGMDTAVDDGSGSGSASEASEIEDLMANVGCFITTAAQPPGGRLNIWSEIRGCNLAMISIVLVLLLLLETKCKKITFFRLISIGNLSKFWLYLHKLIGWSKFQIS